MQARLNFAGAQTIGRRNYQEDVFATGVFQTEEGQTTLLAVVADGMGGHVAGARAAAVATRDFIRTAQNDRPRISNGFAAAINAGNKAISDEVAENPALGGMGCTLLAVEVHGGYLRWVSVGDSVLYLISGNSIQRLNADHSLAPQLDAAAKRNEISWEEAQNSPQRHALRSALTGGALTLVDLPRQATSIAEDDWVVVASDGIASLQETEIVEILRQRASSTAEEACTGLLKAIEDKANPQQDNTTIVVIRVPEATQNDRDDIPTRPVLSR